MVTRQPYKHVLAEVRSWGAYVNGEGVDGGALSDMLRSMGIPAALRRDAREVKDLTEGTHICVVMGHAFVVADGTIYDPCASPSELYFGRSVLHVSEVPAGWPVDARIEIEMTWPHRI